MPPRVVWIAQAPTLLTRLACSEAWNMQVVCLKDAHLLAENPQLQAPVWDGSPEGVAIAFACAPDHVDWIAQNLPNARLVVVAHQGYAQKLPPCPETTPVVAFSEECAMFVRETIGRHVSVIRPWFETKNVWKWQADTVWTMMSRPSTREILSSAFLNTASSLAKVQIHVYGQDQPDGFLDSTQRDAKFASCSSYFSALVPRAGFGLAEHEAMSRGCPVVGAWWGDLATLNRQGFVGIYKQAFTDFGDIYGLAALADRAACDKFWCENMSEAQLDYVRDRYSRGAMDVSIQQTLDEILSIPTVDPAPARRQRGGRMLARFAGRK